MEEIRCHWHHFLPRTLSEDVFFSADVVRTHLTPRGRANVCYFQTDGLVFHLSCTTLFKYQIYLCPSEPLRACPSGKEILSDRPEVNYYLQAARSDCSINQLNLKRSAVLDFTVISGAHHLDCYMLLRKMLYSLYLLDTQGHTRAEHSQAI